MQQNKKSLDTYRRKLSRRKKVNWRPGPTEKN